VNFAADIPLSLARAAHSGTSFVPDERAVQEQEGYASTLAGDYEQLLKHAPTEEKRATLDVEFARYREGYRKRYLAMLASRSRCMSTMITGRSNFPVRRMEKRNAIEHKRLTEVVEFRERALKAIRKALHPELAPIMLGDSDATIRLQQKIQTAELVQSVMKRANAAIRKHAKDGADRQIAELVALGLPEAKARNLLEPDHCGRIGFASYEVTNNAANIRRMKERLAQVETVQAEPASEVQGTAARLEDVPAENRVRLFFPGKPPAEVRERLKSAAFRWTPSLGCWQAYRNHHSLEVARREAGA
jgi:hypothetical protein